jgi:TubC N-terminal docking domain
MRLIELLHYMKEHDIRLAAEGQEGEQLAVDGPAAALTPDVRQALITHKERLLEYFVPFPYWTSE